MDKSDKSRKIRNVLTGFGIGAVVLLIFVGIIATTTAKPSTREQVWDEKMTKGNLDAKNHYIIYSDLICPYCIAFENTLVENEEDFDKYLANNDILLEVRLADYLYEFGDSNPINSRYSAVATFCAKDEGKFWDYYNKAVAKVWNDFFRDDGKAGVKGLANVGKEYWINIGRSVGLTDSFASCVEEDKSLDAVKATAARMAEAKVGMPYFKFNKFTQSGYNLVNNYDYVKRLLNEGLKAENR